MLHESAAAKPNIAQIALNLTGACLISGLIIAVTYFCTADVAARKQVELQNAAMHKLVGQADRFEKVSGKDGWLVAKRGPQVIAYLVPVQSKGYGGAIKMIVAVAPDGRVFNFNILESKETPGLGDKAMQPDFQKQFIGKCSANLNVVKTPTKDAIQALSGATITSKAVTAGVKAAVDQVTQYLGGR